MFKEGGGLTKDTTTANNPKKDEETGMVLANDAPLLIGHSQEQPNLALTLADSTLGAYINATSDPFKNVKQKPLPSFSLGLNCKKCKSKKVKTALGRYPDAQCTSDDQCQSGACVKTAKVKITGRHEYVCRNLNGFPLGHSCFYTRDCVTSKDEFCYHARSSKGVCSKKKKDMTPCELNTQCISGTCAHSFGLDCNIDDKNCLCRPKLGFDTGTRVISAWDCISKKAAKKHKHALARCV
jgi:hypothetical protein